MAYFSNGSEGMDYLANYCDKCIHNYGCVVWDAHMLKNYDECNNDDSILHILIPRSENGLSNEKCKMFVEAQAS